MVSYRNGVRDSKRRIQDHTASEWGGGGGREVFRKSQVVVFISVFSSSQLGVLGWSLPQGMPWGSLKQTAASHPKVPDLVGLGQSPRTCISEEFLSNAGAAVRDLTWKHFSLGNWGGEEGEGGLG